MYIEAIGLPVRRRLSGCHVPLSHAQPASRHLGANTNRPWVDVLSTPQGGHGLPCKPENFCLKAIEGEEKRRY
jgi:hypothetical protein